MRFSFLCFLIFSFPVLYFLIFSFPVLYFLFFSLLISFFLFGALIILLLFLFGALLNPFHSFVVEISTVRERDAQRAKRAEAESGGGR